MDEDQKQLDNVVKLLTKGKSEKAMQLAFALDQEYVSQGCYLKAVALWKQVLQVNPNQLEAHLKLIAFQEQLCLKADVEVQKRFLENICRKENISSEAIEQMKAKLGIS